MADIETVTKWLRKTEGRDKLCKMLQYVCRLLTAYFSTRDEYQHLTYQSLYLALREARKLFRLFKSIDEYQAITHLIFFGEEEWVTLFHIISKVLYFFYWLLDNLSVAAKVKLLRFKWQYMHQLAIRVRFVALIVGVLTFCYEARGLKEDQVKIKSFKAGKNLLDLLPAAKDSGFMPNLNEALAGLGGLGSAVLSTWQIYEEQKIRKTKKQEQ